ncbi:HNH endonuclease [Vibrio sp. 10N.261.52.A1]|uniref:HNH endonuclease n=1 Tax=Vibrio TaxID=662 RepID=UPI000C834BE9|nr:HNH endonuclease [Vibrio sp. 10N.261.52.A1]PML71523.1 hypothetical protein BCT81_06040 [Vibrio sp. 10N.261.52.A1]
MLDCIYCESGQFRPGEGSKEHAILSSLGGRKLSRNICCESCNNRLGKSIDDGLSTELSIISTSLNIKTGRNKSAPTQRDAVILDGESYNLLPTGEMLRGKVKQPLLWKTDEGKTRIRVEANNKEQALKIVEGKLKSLGKSLSDVEEATISHVSKYGAVTEGTFSFDEDDLRSVAKMALTMTATKVSPTRLRSPDFVDVIDYINGSELNVEDIVFADTNSEFPEKYKVSNINHRLFLYSSKKEKLCLALVELFGAFRFSVLLSRSWSGPDISCCYVIDPVSGDKLDIDIEVNNNLQEIIDTRICVQSEAIKQISPLIDYIHEFGVQVEEQRIINEAMLRHNVTVIDSNCSDDFFESVASDLADMHLKISRTHVSKLV